MNKKKIKNKNDDINTPNIVSSAKLKTFFVIIILLIIALIYRLAYIQFVDGEKLQTSATAQQTLTETISAKRGTIYDANGQTLAISYETDKIYIDPTVIKSENKEIVANGIASSLDLDANEVLNKININTKKFVVASDVEQDKVSKLQQWQKSLNKISTGISYEETTSRTYPRSTLASTLLGFTNADNKGAYGIEYSWDSFLSGTAGKSVSLQDAKSQSEIANSEKSYYAAENGYDIYLTIDVNIQSIVEKYLAEAVEDYECDSGITIAMDPSTGKILALADYPSYDCNNRNTPNSKLAANWDSMSSEEKTNAIFKMWTPKAVTDTYEPGSVFKLITSSIGLEENLVDTDVPNTFNCTGYFYVKGEEEPIRCHRYYNPHRQQTLREALMNSCNPAFMELGTKIGASCSYKYYKAFGLFDKTGISLSGESTGIFYDLNTIGAHELATMSFGERITVTPIQMITAISAIANDGVLVQPQIVDKIENTDTGEVTEFTTKEVRQVISKSTADKVASMMESVATKGTGKLIAPYLQGYSFGGKTGTSEPRKGTDEGYTASYVAISPVENTKIVLLVILKNPKGSNHNGGAIAGPTAGKMLAEILPCMGIEYGNKINEINTNVSQDDLY